MATSEDQHLITNAPTAEQRVKFLDIHGRKFYLPAEQCSSANSTRKVVAEELHLDENAFDFWIGDCMINNSTWATNVVPGVEVILRPSVASESTYSPSFSPLSPVPLPQPCSEHSMSTPLSPQVPCLKFSEIWDAEGPYRLPFSGCGDRVFTFINGSSYANLEELNIYRSLRRCAIPERWSDLNGNLVNAGRITTPQRPQINVGPVLAGRLVGLQEVGRYVVIRKAELTKTRDKGESIHLDGDPVYQWVPYPSRQHAEAGLIETFSSGYSVVGSWVELGVSRAGKAALEHFVGEKFDDDGHDIFAVVGSSRRGTQKKTEGARLSANCSIV